MKKVRLALEGALETICKKDKAVEEALENRDEAWFATLLNNHILDVEDSNIYDEVKRRYESP